MFIFPVNPGGKLITLSLKTELLMISWENTTLWIPATVSVALVDIVITFPFMAVTVVPYGNGKPAI